MRLPKASSILICAVAGNALLGCHAASPEGPTATSMPAPDVTTMPASPATQPTAAMPAAKDMTHVLTKDEPYYTVDPAAGSATPAGTLKAGSKVLVIIPGAPYSQVVTDMGVSAYTMTEGLKPLGK